MDNKLFTVNDFCWFVEMYDSCIFVSVLINILKLFLVVNFACTSLTTFYMVVPFSCEVFVFLSVSTVF